MVRPKTELKLLESEISRFNYFVHDKPLVSERIHDLSIITGADVLYIVFSPSGSPPFICLGQKTKFSEIVRRYGELTFYERENRRFKNFETLNNFLRRKNKDMDIDVPVLSNAWKRKRLNDLNEELRNQKARLTEVNKKSCFLAHPKNINSIEKIEEMADPIRKSIDGLRNRKGHLNKLGQEKQNEEATDQQIPVQLPQSPHHGTVNQGISEKGKQPMLQGNGESSDLPTLNVQNVESGLEFNFLEPLQHSNYDLGSYNNFSFTSDLGSYGLDFDFMQEYENLSSYSFFSSILQSGEAGPSNVDKSSSPHFGEF